jgi:hypothetical protein
MAEIIINQWQASLNQRKHGVTGNNVNNGNINEAINSNGVMKYLSKAEEKSGLNGEKRISEN